MSRTADQLAILRKLIADACSYPMFHAFSLLDGVTVPAVMETSDWVGGALETSENGPMLHDEFFDTYWDYAASSGSEQISGDNR